MNRDELKTFIEKNLINSDGKLNPWATRDSWWAKRKETHIKDAIIHETAFLRDTDPLLARIHCIRFGVTAIPTCAVCGEPTNFFKEYKDYAKTCSNPECVLPETKKKRADTNLERHGMKYSFLTSEAMARARVSAQTPESKKKRIATSNKRYGVDNPARSLASRKKISMARKKYLQEHGTFVDALGRSSIQAHYFSDDVWAKIRCKEFWENEHIKNRRPITHIAKELNISAAAACNWYADTTGRHPEKETQSYGEREIESLLRQNYSGDIIINSREAIPSKELDFYIPQYNLGIEFNGLFWHTEEVKGRNYHLEKTKDCIERGIKLLHIFEDEWLDKKEIWESIILHRLQSSPTTIFSRNCSIQKIENSNLVNDFLVENHLQGAVRTPLLSYGLFNSGILVSLMSFGSSRFNKNFPWEIVRFCNKKFHNIPGAAQRLFKHFCAEQKPTSIISYADRRYSDGGLYKSLGMELSGTSQPNYFYIHKYKTKRYSRLAFQKHKLETILENYDPSLSESQNMIANGYSRIYDCGNLVFAKSF